MSCIIPNAFPALRTALRSTPFLLTLFEDSVREPTARRRSPRPRSASDVIGDTPRSQPASPTLNRRIAMSSPVAPASQSPSPLCALLQSCRSRSTDKDRSSKPCGGNICVYWRNSCAGPWARRYCNCVTDGEYDDVGEKDVEGRELRSPLMGGGIGGGGGAEDLRVVSGSANPSP